MIRFVWMWVGLLHKHGKVQATPAIAAGIRSQNIRLKAIACLLMLSAAWVLPAPALSAAQALAAGGQSANKEAVSGISGPGSVPGTLDTDRKAKGIDAARVDYVEAYFDFKRQIKENYGLAFGFDYNAIYQAASKSLGDDAAAGGVLRMFGQWTLTGRGTQNTGTLIYKVENRHRIGTDIAPQALGFEAGYVGLTAVPFSDIGWALTNLYWNQNLWGNRVALVGGVVDSTDYVDIYGLVNPWADFSNLAFSTDPTIPVPNQGLGAAVRFMATDNVYFLGGIADANGDPTDPGDTFDSFFNTAEFFTHIEFGWVASMEKAFSDNIHLTLWHMDAREQARTADGWGAAFSFSRLFAEKWEPFLRIGYAEDGGAMWEKSIGAGIGYHPNATSDALGAGLNWSRPSQDTFGSDLNDQYTAEIYYRWQALKMLAITPDIQLLFNPALYPDEDLIIIWGLRARFSF